MDGNLKYNIIIYMTCVADLNQEQKISLFRDFLQNRNVCLHNCFNNHYNKVKEACEKCAIVIEEFENTHIKEKIEYKFV